MMLYLRLFYEFAKIGLFSIGGGLATLPFLYSLADKTGWFTAGRKCIIHCIRSGIIR